MTARIPHEGEGAVRRYRARDARAATVPILFVVAGLALLCGCAVGPDYERPDATAIPPAYAGETGGWKVAQPQAQLPKGNWWEVFGEPQLNALEAEASASNQQV